MKASAACHRPRFPHGINVPDDCGAVNTMSSPDRNMKILTYQRTRCPAPATKMKIFGLSKRHEELTLTNVSREPYKGTQGLRCFRMLWVFHGSGGDSHVRISCSNLSLPDNINDSDPAEGNLPGRSQITSNFLKLMSTGWEKPTTVNCNAFKRGIHVLLEHGNLEMHCSGHWHNEP
jgi:hypothetical protein